MPLYGHSRAVVDEESVPLELREVSLLLAPADLRRVARFLDHVADEIERGRMKTSHMHMEMLDADWRRDHPESDLIVLNPGSTPLVRAGGVSLLDQ